MRQSADIIIREIKALREVLKAQALEHKAMYIHINIGNFEFTFGKDRKGLERRKEDVPVEEAPVEALVEAVVEEVPGEDEGGFELVVEEPPEESEGPQTIEEAHEDLLDKLLGK